MTKLPEDICLGNIGARSLEHKSTIIKTESHCYVVCHHSFTCFLLIVVLLLCSIIAIYHKSFFIPNVCQSKECFRSAAAFKQSMDLLVNPCDDFYSYVCGHWADDNPRPKEYIFYSWVVNRQITTDGIIRNHLESNISQSDPKPVAQVKQMYKACRRSLVPTKTNGFEGIQKYLDEFELPAVPTLLNLKNSSNESYNFDWISSVAKIQRKLGLDVLVGFVIGMDHLNKDHLGIWLGDNFEPKLREFPLYVWTSLQPKGYSSRTKNKEPPKLDVEDDTKDDKQKEDSIPEKVAKNLQRLVTTINPTFNTTNVTGSFLTLAEQFLAFHKQLPKVEDNSEDEKPAYYTVAELQNITDSYITPRKPYPVWQHYLDIVLADLPDTKPSTDEKFQSNARNVEFLGNLTGFLSKQSSEIIELYVWKAVTEFLVDHPLNKLKTEENCIESLYKFMGLAVSYTIADKNFLKETKPRVEQMLNNIQREFNQTILETDWMDAYTRNASIEKSKAMESLIGFPEWILDVDKLEEHYRGLQVDEFHHFDNWVNALQLHFRENLQFLHVNMRHLWNTNPTEINAYYSKFYNKIGIPVAMIQYPYYYLGLEALNYGAIGHSLGHELIHGFDNLGRHLDKFGNRGQWWSNQTNEEFNKRASCLVEQYDKYFVPEVEGFVNGTITLTENIADNGGIRQAFHAYRSYAKKNGPEPLLPGFKHFTHEQLFFISFGNQYCQTLASNYGRGILKLDHSPGKFRVLGVLSNMEEFSEAFQCPRGSKMNPEKKCRVW